MAGFVRRGIGFASALGIVTAALLGAQSARSEPMRLEPGEWEFRSVSSHPMSGDREHVEKVCIDERGITPERFMEETDGCRVVDPKSDAGSMSWDVDCSQAGARMTGRATLTSTGTTVEGVMEMKMDMGSMKVEMQQTWQGKRLGDC